MRGSEQLLIAACLCMVACSESPPLPAPTLPDVDASSKDMDSGAMHDARAAVRDAASSEDAAAPRVDASTLVDPVRPFDAGTEAADDEDAGQPSDAGGDASSPNCIAGEYAFSLSPLSGNCGHVFETYHLTFGASGSLTTIEMFLNDEVITETVVKGCSGRFARTVRTTQGLVTQQLTADSVMRTLDGTLAGDCELIRYNELNQVACRGTYMLEPPTP